MANENSRVLFKFGSRAQYDAIPSASIQSNALYFLTDTNELYRGSVPICQAHYYEGTIGQNETRAQAITRITTGSTPVVDDILILNIGNNIKIPYIYAGLENDANPPVVVNDWRPMFNKLAGEDVVFEDGETLSTKLAAAASSGSSGMDYTALDGDVFTVIEDANQEPEAFTLKDYGVQYYAYDSQNETYVLTTVDGNHPWPTGLTPRTTLENGRVVIGWYEPDPTTGAGQSAAISALQTDVADLKTIVGHAASGNDPSTGLIHAVESAITGISIDGTALTPVSGVIDIEIFDGTNNGLVPAPANNLSGTYLLTSDGTWVSPDDVFSIEWEELQTQNS